MLVVPKTHDACVHQIFLVSVVYPTDISNMWNFLVFPNLEIDLIASLFRRANDATMLLAAKLLSEVAFSVSKCFRSTLKNEFYYKRVRGISRAALLDPKCSGFVKLLQSRCNTSMITATGLDFRSFEQLLVDFQWYFDRYMPNSYDGKIRPLQAQKTGRKRLVSAKVCLGLALSWTRTRGSLYYL